MTDGSVESSAWRRCERASQAQDASVVIWTTTPWTIPGNRAISFSPKITYGLYEVTRRRKATGREAATSSSSPTISPSTSWQRRRSRISARLRRFPAHRAAPASAPRIRSTWRGYDFEVPLLAGEHVTDDTGTGFVHTAPGHGTEDFEVSDGNRAKLDERGIDVHIPFTVDEAGFFTEDAPGFDRQTRDRRQGQEGRRQRCGDQAR